MTTSQELLDKAVAELDSASAAAANLGSIDRTKQKRHLAFAFMDLAAVTDALEEAKAVRAIRDKQFAQQQNQYNPIPSDSESKPEGNFL